MTPPRSTDRFLAIATAGHVDHGKTSLVRHLTGVDTDTLAEEKARGLTISTGYAYRHFHTGSGQPATLGFVDVPGHSDFIHNMLAGVGAVHSALLVVAADDGVMPQTREHLAILELLGVNRLSIALTKVDRCAAERVAEATEQIRSLLASTPFADAPFFEIDNLSGGGVAQLAAHLETLTQQGDEGAAEDAQRPRFLIDRCFVAKGIGTLVTGTMVAGTIGLGESLTHSASGREARIRAIRLDKSDRDQLSAGQRAALNLSLSHELIQRGDWLGADDAGKLRLDVELRLLDASLTLKQGVDYHLHMGAAHRLARVRPLDAQDQLYQLSLDETVSAYWGDRFILRDPSARRTLGGGRVLDVAVPNRGRASAERLAALRAQRGASVEALAELTARSEFGIELASFAQARNLAPPAVDALLSRLPPEISSISLPGEAWPHLIAATAKRQREQVIVQAVTAFHGARPSEMGMNEKALISACGKASAAPLVTRLVQQLVSSGALRRSGNQLSLPTHRVQASREREEFEKTIEPLLRRGGLTPPRTREIVEATGIPLKAVERILQDCARAGAAVRVADNRYYLPATIDRLADQVGELMVASAGRGFSVIEFRDKTQMGRNLCIEVLEYFDAVGFTLRRENLRVVRREWKASGSGLSV